MRNGLILMTALPPTMGHKYLIDFAVEYISSLPDGGYVCVLLNSRECEPIPGNVRFQALLDHYSDDKRRRLVFYHYDKDVPQNPSEHPDFWNFWKDLIREVTTNEPGDIVFASELYGIDLAKVLECEFIPANIYREVVQVTGTKVRKAPWPHFDLILPEMQPYFQMTVTVFGAESCGKTTLSKRLAHALEGQWVPEWAREYLETCGEEVTAQKMRNITHAQHASQVLARKKGKPVIVQDTDLLSTIGYYRIMGIKPCAEIDRLARETKSDFYLMMNDRIPFEPDPLRYGGDRRESDMKFWIDILEEYGCNYYVVHETEPNAQLAEAQRQVANRYEERFRTLRDFVRT